MNFYKKHYLLVVTWNKTNLLKQVAPITYTLEKRFFAVDVLLKVCQLFLFRQSKKTSGVPWSSLDLSEKRRPSKYCL